MGSNFARGRLTDLPSIQRAIDRRMPISLILVREGPRSDAVSAVAERARAAGVAISIESEREMRRMSETGDAPELLAVTGPPPTHDLATLMAAEGLVLILIGLRYPGNIGFILRSAEVAGAAGVVVANDWAGSEWQEAQRVGMRAQRFLSVLEVGAGDAIAAARSAGRRLVAVETSGSTLPWEVDLSKSTALMMGGETKGISGDFLAQADEVVRIPTRGFIPSYNVQAATGMLLGEWLRQTRDA